MLSGATFSAPAIAGTAVFRMVVSSDSMKNAMATSHGSNLLPDVCKGVGAESAIRAIGLFPQHRHQPQDTQADSYQEDHKSQGPSKMKGNGSARPKKRRSSNNRQQTYESE